MPFPRGTILKAIVTKEINAHVGPSTILTWFGCQVTFARFSFSKQSHHFTFPEDIQSNATIALKAPLPRMISITAFMHVTEAGICIYYYEAVTLVKGYDNSPSFHISVGVFIRHRIRN
jgi:hypothetical protein